MLTDFYINFVNSLADSVEKLAKIQEEFPDKYETVAKLEEDPGLIEELSKNLSSEEKEKLLTILIRMSSLARRSNRIFELTVEEKRILAKDLRKFVADLQKDLLEQTPKKV